MIGRIEKDVRLELAGIVAAVSTEETDVMKTKLCAEHGGQSVWLALASNAFYLTEKKKWVAKDGESGG